MKHFRERKFIKFYLGNIEIRSHIDALHACPPKPDKFTGDIVEGVSYKINCSGIIAIVSRTVADLNRPPNNKNKEAINEYRQTIKEILVHTGNLEKDGKLTRPYLHLAIHGMKDKWGSDIEIGTLNNKTCSPEVKKWFVSEIKKRIKKSQIDKNFPGDISKSFHRHGDQTGVLSYIGYGTNFNTFQIEISRTLRENYRKGLIGIFSDIILRFNEQFQ
jgi:hypothetical protein